MHTKLWARTDYSSLTDVRASPMYGHFRPTRRIQVIQEQAYAVADRVPKEVCGLRVIYLLRSRMKNKDAPPSFDSRDEKAKTESSKLLSCGDAQIYDHPIMLMIVAMMIPQYTRDIRYNR